MTTRTYEPTAADVMLCPSCGQSCVPHPHRTSPTCSWCWYRNRRFESPEPNPVRAERGYGAIAAVFAICGVLVAAMILFVTLGIVGRGCGVVNEALDVTHDEFGPRALLKKYEWFKTVSAQLDKKHADIDVYAARFADLKEQFGPPSTWPRDVREQSLVWRQELAGVKASYNGLAADYNAQMAKFNWRFANAGSLPAGATEPLPREYRPYEGN